MRRVTTLGMGSQQIEILNKGEEFIASVVKPHLSRQIPKNRTARAVRSAGAGSNTLIGTKLHPSLCN
jgi:hypothetical protein